jgi:hypothetical protein
MISHLLQLPGKLRNKIVEYAFTIDDGVCYREDKLGVGWLCLHPQESRGDVKEHDQTPAVVAGARKPGDEAPARKRRKIKEADCATDKAVIGTKETMRPAQVTVNGHVVANQLQFVNHQLRTETRALVIRYNDIHILDKQRHLKRFLYIVVGHKRLWIQKIIQRVELSSLNTLRDINPDEKMHPHFMIHIHLPLASIDKGQFFLLALYARQWGRQNYSYVGRLFQSIVLQQILLNLPITTSEIPYYIKLFPWNREFDEAAMRRYCEEDGPEQKLPIRTLPDDIEGMVAMAKEWFENGY